MWLFYCTKKHENLINVTKGKILTDIITTIIYISIRKELINKGISVSNMIGSTQSLMCFKDKNDVVTVEVPNKNVLWSFKYKNSRLIWFKKYAKIIANTLW